MRFPFFSKKICGFVLSLIFLFNVSFAEAAISSGTVTLSTPAASASSVSYTFQFSGFNTGTAAKCVQTTFSTAVGGTTLPTGMSIASAAMSASSTLFTSTNWGSATITNGVAKWTYTTGETPASGAKTLIVTGITNGSTVNTTYYTRLATFSDTACTSALDTGDLAFAFTTGVTVSATVNPTLTFTVDSTTCSLGTLTNSTTGTCSHTMTAATNANSGYNIGYIATTTLTSAESNTIAAIGATKAASATNSEQFGLNLKLNTSPSVGADPSSGSGAAATQYDTTNQFAFTTAGANVASASTSSLLTTFTVSFIANITATTKAGSYSTTVTYRIVPNY